MNFKSFTERIENVIEFAISKSIQNSFQNIEGLNKPKQNQKENELLTTEQVIYYLKISRCTVHNLIKRGQLKPIQFSSRKNLFKKGEVEKLVESFQIRGEYRYGKHV